MNLIIIIKSSDALARCPASDSQKGMSALDCPRCGQPLAQRFVESSSAHVCQACSGVWLDAHDLNALCPTLAHLPERHQEMALCGVRGGGLTRCPRCAEVPVEVVVLEVAVDFCTGCRGVWLDPGEYAEPDGAPAAAAARRKRSTYRSAPADGAPPACVHCGRELDPKTAFMREHGATCPSCHYALEQRLQALRAEPNAFVAFLQSVAEAILRG